MGVPAQVALAGIGIIQGARSRRHAKISAREQKAANRVSQRASDLSFERQKKVAIARQRQVQATALNKSEASGAGTGGSGVQGQVAASKASLFGQISLGQQLKGAGESEFDIRQRASDSQAKSSLFGQVSRTAFGLGGSDAIQSIFRKI